MSYGLDMDDVCYITDAWGKPTHIVLTITKGSALVEFWNAARRAETARIEASARPGMYRSHLSQIVPGGTADEAPVPGRRYGRQWEALIARMPADGEPIIDASPAPPPAVISRATQDAPPADEPAATVAMVAAHGYFPREFLEAPLPEVAAMIGHGVPVFRAWRRYRSWTLREVGELSGTSASNIKKHEQGIRKPSKDTLAMFARLFDCTVGQLTPKPGSNTKPSPAEMNGTAPPRPVPTVRREPRAPDDTDYPDVVLAGKTPLTAWRLYRRLTVAELAGQYGCGRENMRQLVGMQVLHEGTIRKLCAVLHCKPEQMLRPAGLEVEPAPVHAHTAGTKRDFQRGKSDGRQARTA